MIFYQIQTTLWADQDLGLLSSIKKIFSFVNCGKVYYFWKVQFLKFVSGIYNLFQDQTNLYNHKKKSTSNYYLSDVGFSCWWDWYFLFTFLIK